MNPLQLGSTLLQQYRIDRFRRRKDGVFLYEGVDASRLRRVCIKLLDRSASKDIVKCARFHDEAHRANVIDIGTCEGLPYFVTTECELVPPPARRSSKPPPLPKRASSKPPPLPKSKPPPLPEIPIFLDEDALLVSTPPPPPIASDPILPTTFEPRPRARARAPWLLFVALTAITGFAGWYVGRSQADVAPAVAAEPITQAATAATAEKPPTLAPVIEPDAAPSAVEPAPETTAPKPRPRATVDPLTI